MRGAAATQWLDADLQPDTRTGSRWRPQPSRYACVLMTMSSRPSAISFLTSRASFARNQPRELRDAQWEPGKTLAEAAVMLPGQQGRRHDHRDLRAGHRGDKGGGQRHLGLADADIAADQPVHRLARGHIDDRAQRYRAAATTVNISTQLSPATYHWRCRVTELFGKPRTPKYC